MDSVHLHRAAGLFSQRRMIEMVLQQLAEGGRIVAVEVGSAQSETGMRLTTTEMVVAEPLVAALRQMLEQRVRVIDEALQTLGVTMESER